MVLVSEPIYGQCCHGFLVFLQGVKWEYYQEMRVRQSWDGARNYERHSAAFSPVFVIPIPTHP